MKISSQKRIILMLLETSKERMRIMKNPFTSPSLKVDLPTNARLGLYPLFMISEAFRTWCRGI